MIDVVIPTFTETSEKNHNLERTEEELDRMWRVEATVVPVVTGTFRALTLKLDTVQDPNISISTLILWSRCRVSRSRSSDNVLKKR